MHHKTWRLVNDQYVVVFKKNVQRNFFGSDIGGFQRGKGYGDGLIGPYPVARLRPEIAHANAPLLDE
jgi:hypothetical protein